MWNSPQPRGVREAHHLVNSKFGSSLAFLIHQSLSKKEHNEGSDTSWWMYRTGWVRLHKHCLGVLGGKCSFTSLQRVRGHSLPTQQLTLVHQQSDLLCTVAENMTPARQHCFQQFSSNWASFWLCSRRTMTAATHGGLTPGLDRKVQRKLKFFRLLFHF